MARRTIHLNHETALALHRLAGVRGCSEADLIREALASYIKRSTRLAAKGIGKYRSGEPDVARRAKEILSAAAKRGRWR